MVGTKPWHTRLLCHWSLVTGHWFVLCCFLMLSDVVFLFPSPRAAAPGMKSQASKLRPAGRPKFDLNVVGGVRGGGRRRAVRD
jgi:hypothetical protein